MIEFNGNIKDLKLRSLYTPVIANIWTESGYIHVTTCEQGWIKIPMHFTLEDLKSVWEPIIFEDKNKNDNEHKHLHEIFHITASNGKDKYAVTLENFGWSCECAGYGFRRKCRHIEEAKKLIK